MDENMDLKAKTTWFRDLYALDDIDDETPDAGLLHSEAAMKRKKPDKDSIPDPSNPRIASKKRRIQGSKSSSPAIVIPPLLSSATSSASLPSKAEQMKKSAVKGPAKSFPVISTTSNAKIFDGLHFYFFPNDQRHPGRRFRIEKAQQHGAVWEQAWSAKITHVVVDRSMDFDQVKRFLKLDIVPPNIHFVDEKFPADCISFRSVLDPSQQQYRIRGFVPVQQTPEERATTRENGSLQLKLAKQDVQAQEVQTPSQRTDITSLSEPSPTKRIQAAPASILSDGWESAGRGNSSVLEEAITEARRLQALLIDEDEIDSEASDGETSVGTKGPVDVPDWQQRFQCMQSNVDAKKDGPNATTIALLQEMADHYVKTHDEWRAMAYRKAIATLRKHPVKISTKEEAAKLPFVGNRLAAKIEEISYTGLLQRLEHAKAEPLDQTLQLFMNVYGIGFARANNFVAQGYKTLDDLREKAKLDQNQRIGLDHFDDFNTRIPRAEVKQHSDIVAQTAKRFDSDITIYTMGSYRRGAETSGDIDIVMTHPTWPVSGLRKMLMDTLVPKLFTTGFLKCSLAATSRVNGTKWHGASCLPKSTVWRRIDFLLVPADELGAALIYFTGNDIFNRSMRLLASKRGYRLNQRGLYKEVMRDKERQKITEGEKVAGRNEKEIFEALGVPWREPWERIC